MKTLILVRHAKSSWDDYSIADIDRPLNERGKKDAPEMAGKLLKKKIKIDLFVSSPAKRAKKTAKKFIEEFGGNKHDILLVEKLYEASVKDFEEAVSEISDTVNSAAVFSHNPGITAYANTLTSYRIDDMPTCAVFVVKADVESWKDFKSAEKEPVLFDYPKNFQM